MIPTIKKILYATDLSENALYAFGYAASLSNRYNAGITILHVVEEMSPSLSSHIVDLLGEERWRDMLEQNTEELIGRVRDRLDRFTEQMKNDLVDCPFTVDDILVRQGRPSEMIMLQAETIEYDMIVMGTHGYGLLAGALMGSTARRVVRRTETPVMVIRLPEEK